MSRVKPRPDKVILMNRFVNFIDFEQNSRILVLHAVSDTFR